MIVAGPRTRMGLRGEVGPRGEQGPRGESGQAPEHEWRDSELRFRKPNGAWGKWVDLRGPPGKNAKAPYGTVIAATFDENRILMSNEFNILADNEFNVLVGE